MVFPIDYVISKENSSTIVSIDQITPILGLGSLQVFISDASPIIERLSIQNNTYTNGILDGRIRSVIRIDTMTTDVTDRVGFASMQSSSTINGVSDTGYGVVISAGNELSTPLIEIIKYSNGFQTVSILDSVSVGTLGLGISFVLQMEWVTNSILDGTLIRGYIGVNTTDFNDLVKVVEVVDETSPFTVSTTEGLIVTSFGSVPPALDVKFDELSIFSLT